MKWIKCYPFHLFHFVPKYIHFNNEQAECKLRAIFKFAQVSRGLDYPPLRILNIIYKNLEFLRKQQLQVLTIVVLSSSTSWHQYGGGKSQPAKAHVLTSSSPIVCKTEFVVLWDTKYVETETNNCQIVQVIQCNTEYKKMCEPKEEQECKMEYQRECNTERQQLCMQKYRDEWEFYTETECKDYPQNTCKKVKKERLKQIPYKDCVTVPKHVCEEVPALKCSFAHMFRT
jgi:hypothetical protein